ncbi:MAG: phage baseplate assembly protein V [Crocosphaera sp.]|nr:phage baseplate assembly protein V [Crocosphaera sp.]
MYGQEKRYFGKYRGKVASTKDSEKNLGRIQVVVPAILGEGRLSWAMPCVPYAGKDIGFFTVPPVGSNIWVEFEGGDIDYPIWSGCFWGENELPKNASKLDKPEEVQVFRNHGITFTWSNLGDNKGLTIEVENPAVQRPLKMVFNADGIEINNNNETTIKLTADIIELKNRGNSTITIAQDSIQLKESSVEIKLTPSTIELINAPATIKLTKSNIESSVTSATVKTSASGVEVKSGGLGNINVGLGSVNVNNGALEVT